MTETESVGNEVFQFPFSAENEIIMEIKTAVHKHACCVCVCVCSGDFMKICVGI